MEWETNYKPSQPSQVDTSTTSSVMSAIVISVPIITSFEVLQGADKYFHLLDDVVATEDPISEWINSPPFTLTVDPITYWTGLDATGHPLARMALDFLSIPGA